MKNMSFSCYGDRNLVARSYEGISKLLFGYKQRSLIDRFTDVFDERVTEIRTTSEDIDTRFGKAQGLCEHDKDTDTFRIIMHGYKNHKDVEPDFIKHEGFHELSHAFVNILPSLYQKDPNGIIKKGIKRVNNCGMIKETDSRSGKLVGNQNYGKLFNETMMDINAVLADNYYGKVCEDQSRITADDIFLHDYSKWDSPNTAYSMFTSITRLMIAAFSNSASVTYDYIIRTGESIYTTKVKMRNGQNRYLNDFLYGINFDPLHVEKEFDKYTGEDNYRLFCEMLDILFIRARKGEKLPKDHVKYVMSLIASFHNARINDMLKSCAITQVTADQLTSTFNIIWNGMETEYNAYFNIKDISDILKRVREYQKDIDEK